ncbi:LOW QUALITY PROTEIN: zona pellucida sperm-binding protein 3-like [Micropterus salmoides]|uniref:LOW QUALITY PROTEIN: zona pellucida sperm-binding protein 3-like n=1 Tax=Micropterus salmoides TaxID=27706 RepID=UPI0018EB98BC|nr:LOW QUALITY PROTEIN: zona pellucida sperm-binding protein 3-like [Micropterus salmoides]
MWFETTYWLSQCMRKKIFVRRLADAKEGSNALCQRRTRTSSLQLDAFLFQWDSRNSIYITCQLKATSEMWSSSPINKVFNYVHSRWENVDGGDDVCQCCRNT